MNVLVTGGAGYVGSVTTEECLKQGHNVTVVDNLQQGHRQAVSAEARLAVIDIRDSDALETLFCQNPVDAVIHMAGETIVEYSVSDPRRYFENNIAGGIRLLDILLKHNVNKIIFSSSASVYGEPQIVPINEDHPQKPLNAYGETKLMFERILEWYGRAYGLKHLSLRYFNAGGASVALGEDHHPETHLIPNVLQAALDANRSLSIFGSDYPTRDGSCIRDYVHVIDIAQAHLLALEKLEMLSGRVYNLGNGAGSSVMELIAAARKITGNEIQFKIYPRRAGDPAVLTASPELAKAELGWKPRFPQLEAILESAWAWKKNHPNGYEP